MTSSSRVWPVIAGGLAVFAAYVSTAARTVTRWDSGEFLAAVHSLGIPHPPGTPLYVLAARVWAMLPLPLPFAARVNLFSVVCGAAAVTLLGLLVRRWSGDTIAGVAATLCAGGTATLWLSATEAEVYAPALLAAILLLAIPEWVRGGLHTTWTLLAFAAGLAWTLHPAALVTLPAAVLLAFHRPGPEVPPAPGGRLWKFAAPVGAALLGISVVLFLLIRAQHDPAINQGNPVTIGALRDVLMREQYPSYGFWPRQAPLWLQLGNWFEYADWQFALGLSPGAPPSWLRTPITVLFGLLGAIGLAAHRRIDRRSWRAMLLAFLAATVGLVLYLNMRLGPSFGGDFLPAGALREARERDYFFTAAFVLWGAWAGLGAVLLGRRIGGPRELEVGGRVRGATPWLTAAVIVSAAPLLLNCRYVHAQRVAAGWMTRTGAVGILESLPAGAVFLALGDNDTYPLWYAQVVEGVRPDVAVITVPLLATRWNREEVARRHGFASLLTAVGTSGAVVAVCRDAAAMSRPVFLTPYAPTSRLSAQCPRLQATGTPVNPG